ncbi:MAG: hypothetical protein H0W72_03005 [Planctomycetes bacterium]|nr:hypothetical protein [Planctomycetota bacterium]
MLVRIRDFSRNPQDLVTHDDLAAFLQVDLGVDLDTSERLIAWLLVEQYLVERTSSYYDGDRGEVVVQLHYRHGAGFRRTPPSQPTEPAAPAHEIAELQDVVLPHS